MTNPNTDARHVADAADENTAATSATSEPAAPDSPAPASSGDDPTPAIETSETRLRITAVLSLLVALFGAGLFSVRVVEQTREASAAALEQATRAAEVRAADASERRATLAAENSQLQSELRSSSARLERLQREHARTQQQVEALDQALALAKRSATQASAAPGPEAQPIPATASVSADDAHAGGERAEPAHPPPTAASGAENDSSPQPGAPRAGAADAAATAPTLSERWNRYAALQARFTEAGLMVTLSDQALSFAPGSAALPDPRPTALTSALDEVATLLAQQPQLRVEVRGHSDSTGAAEANLQLSQERAAAVADALSEWGVARDRIRTLGRGERAPIAANNTAAGRARNRRVELVLMAETSAGDR